MAREDRDMPLSKYCDTSDDNTILDDEFANLSDSDMSDSSDSETERTRNKRSNPTPALSHAIRIGVGTADSVDSTTAPAGSEKVPPAKTIEGLKSLVTLTIKVPSRSPKCTPKKKMYSVEEMDLVAFFNNRVKLSMKVKSPIGHCFSNGYLLAEWLSQHDNRVRTSFPSHFTNNNREHDGKANLSQLKPALQRLKVKLVRSTTASMMSI